VGFRGINGVIGSVTNLKPYCVAALKSVVLFLAEDARFLRSADTLSVLTDYRDAGIIL
jgi:hypothetical protein